MTHPLAYFLTWTCYGTRLHGEERDTVDEEHRRRGSAFVSPNARRVEYETRLLKHLPLVLTDEMRTVVDRTIREHADIRTWKILALNVRTTHVHAVVQGAQDKRPEDVMGQFKAWSSRRLREASLLPAERDLWTFHGSTRWINTSGSLAEAIHYVLHEQ
jgi:REP element-mobilizing transposase RayT